DFHVTGVQTCALSISSGVGFCVYEVTVNGITSTDEINSAAFEIDLSVFGFALGEPVVVTINYKEGCLPSVLNPGVLNAKTSFVEIGRASCRERMQLAI